MLAQIGPALEFVDKASQQSDRWLFLASLVILLFFVGLVIKWLVEHINGKDIALVEKEKKFDAERLEARREFLESLRAQRNDFREELQQERATIVTSLNKLVDVTTVHVNEAQRIWANRNENK